MKGGVRKRGKKWSYYFDTKSMDGERKKNEKGGFRTQGEAEKALRIAMVDYENGGYVQPKSTTFMQFAHEWLEEYVKPLRKTTTYNRYKELINKYLQPFTGVPIQNITAYQIEQLLMSNRNNISGSTLQGIYTLINTIMERAIKLRVIKENPCKYVERPKREKFTPDTLDVSEVELLINALNLSNKYDFAFYTGFRLTLELGLRRGELCGLEWKNVNFKENLITIKNNLAYSNGHVLMSTPKTAESCRSIYISDDLLELLKKFKIRQSENKLKYGEFYRENIFNEIKYDFILTWENGSYIHPMYFLNKLKKVLVKAGINKNIRFHDLRHTNATLLLSQGVDFKTIQTRLGHKDINTTLNIYSHVNKEMQKDATDKLNNIFGGKLATK
ncbi:MAG: tyrosine-type recombinase/integrase [Clostridiaceae bacterium]